MTKRFTGLDLVDRVPEELLTEVHNIVQEAGTKTIPKNNKCKKAKWLTEKVLSSSQGLKIQCPGQDDDEEWPPQDSIFPVGLE